MKDSFMKFRPRKAFSLLEVIFVIVILGIVASIGSTIIAQLYENYIIQRATHRVSLKTELAINQIVNRLSYRIGGTLIARNPTTQTFMDIEDTLFGATNRNNIVLEWIGYDNDSFATAQQPAWSGYCDTNTTRVTATIGTPGSNLANVATIVNNLSPAPNPQLALLYSLGGRSFSNAVGTIGTQCYGYDGNATCIHQVAIQDNVTFTTNNFIPGNGTNISDQYKLAWTAYAIVPVSRTGAVIAAGDKTVNFDLELRYGYQPWAGSQYTTASRSIIARNVTAFKFSEQGGTVRLKLCATEQVGDLGSSVNVSACKEKVVMR